MFLHRTLLHKFAGTWCDVPWFTEYMDFSTAEFVAAAGILVIYFKDEK